MEIRLTEAEREQLERWCRGHQTPRALAERARIILEAAAGVGNNEIAQHRQTRPARVSKWRLRFAEQRCAGLYDAPRRGSRVNMGWKRNGSCWRDWTVPRRWGMRAGTAVCWRKL